MIEPERSLVYSVPVTYPDGTEGRLGPYFGRVEAQSQATRAHNKGAVVRGLDSGWVDWRPDPAATGVTDPFSRSGPITRDDSDDDRR